ncbi:MAG TPA: choice-of-anchor D domain-containing protein [Chryseosolibacter sp.]
MQWHYRNTGQSGGTPGADISLIQAWAVQTGSPDVIVAVIDGGIDVNHPDLAGSMWINDDEVPGNSIDDDGNGYVDDIYGYGFGDNTGTIRPNFHGTHVGGTIAAVTNNEVGVSGIAGGSGSANGVRLMSCAGFGEFGTGGFEDAMVYAADNGAVISQNSWGGGSQAIEDAIDYFIARAGYDNSEDNFDDNVQIGPMAGGLVIFAAGNSNTDNPAIGYPASYAPVMAVASTDHSDVRSYFSNYGSWVDIAAPGSNVYSTYPVSLGSYEYLSGTSMACPHVSGVAALIISEFQGAGLDPNQVWDRLEGTADNIDEQNPSYVDLLGAGRVNAFQALQTEDDIPPAAITNLAVSAPLLTSIKLTWTAPGASDMEGAASAYEIRYSTSVITAANFPSATLASNIARPQGAGAIEVFEVTGLLSNSTYYFAIKARDFFGNVSALSNIVSATTLQPPVISVEPASIAASLFAGESTTRNLTVRNNGLSDLFISTKTRQAVEPDPGIARSRTLANSPILNRQVSREAYQVKLQSVTPVHTSTRPDKSLTTPVRGRLFALNHSSGHIQEYNTSTGAVVKSISPPESFSGGPDGLAFDGSYLYYISGWGSNDIHKIDAETGAVVSTLSLGSIPTIDALAHSGSYVYALDYSNAVVYEINFDEGQVVRTIDPGISIGGGITFGGSRGTLFVSNFNAGIYEIDLESGEVINTLPAPGNIYGLGYSEELGVLFVANVSTGTADAVDPDSGTKLYSLSSILAAAMASDEGGTSWLKIPEDAPTVVTPGSSVIVPVIIDSDGLTSGAYTGNVVVSSNDPVTPIVEIPVTLTVTGAPNLIVTPGELIFSDVFVGSQATMNVLFKNNGTDALTITSITINNSAFTVADEDVIILAGETHASSVSFLASTTGSFTGGLIIESNDPDQPVLTIGISANAVLPPDVVVTPSALASELFVNQVQVHDVTISNMGSAPLVWSLTSDPRTTPSFWSAPQSQAQAVQNNSNQLVTSAVTTGPFQLAVGEFSAKASSPRVLTCLSVHPATGKIYAQENQGTAFFVFDPFTNTWSTVASAPLSSGNNGGAVFLNGKIYTVYTNNSSTMAVYDVASNSWSTMTNALLSGTANITTDGVHVYLLVGNTFKRYNPSDNTWTGLAIPPFSYQAWGGIAFHNGKIFGHQGDGYAGFASYDIATNSWTQLASVPAGTVLGAAIDPVAGKYYTYGSYNGNNWYGYDIATAAWEVNTIPLFSIHDGGLAYVGKGGATGIYFAQGETGTGFGRFESASGWISTDVTSGTLLAGSSETVKVTVNSEGLLGGEYESALVISTNDPDELEVEIPVSLRVIGSPDINVPTSELAFGNVFLGSTVSKTLIIQNAGTDVLEVSELAGTGEDFTFSISPFQLNPGQTHELSITFTPSSVGTKSGSVTLRTNDPDELTVEILLSGVSQLAPVMQVNPLALEAELFSNETATRIMTISNTGGSNLNWTIELGSASTTDSPGTYSLPEKVMGLNNTGAEVSSEILGQVPLAPGDFHSMASSSTPLTCFTTDNTTGYLYAQANQGTAFFRYIPATNTWSSLQPAPVNSGNNGGAVVLNGKIYTTYTGTTAMGVYDIASDTWASLANGLGTGTGNIATDGVYVYLVAYYTLVRYSPTANQWTTLASPPIGFQLWGGIQYLDGNLYGHQGNGEYAFAKYNISSNTWTTLASLPGGAVLGSAIEPLLRKYYAYGSYGGNNWYIYDMNSNTWSARSIPLFNVSDGGMAYVRNGRNSGIYFLQGELGNGFGKYELGSNSAWLSTDLVSGSVPPGETQEVEVTIDATGLSGGSYEGLVRIESNDPETSNVDVPVSLFVTSLGEIEVDPTSVTFPSTRVGRNADTYISITNSGTTALFVSQFASNNDVFTATFSPFTVEPGGTRQVSIRFLPVTAGNFSGTFTISSDDSDEPQVEIAVSGTGLSAPELQLSHDRLAYSVYSGQSVSTDISLSNLGQVDLLWIRSITGTPAPNAAQPSFVVEEKHKFPYVVNNANERIDTRLSSDVYPLAPGDFSLKAASPSQMTCVTSDPSTGILYAQAKYSNSFYRYSPIDNQWSYINSSPLYSGANGGAVVLNNKIYTVYVDNSSSIGVYDIATGVWTTISNGLALGTMNITTDGQRIYLVAGTTFKSYDPITTSWNALSGPPFIFSRWGAIGYKDGIIYGHQGDGGATFGKYFLSDDRWELLSALPGGAIGGAAIDLQSNKYYTYGNYYGNSLYAFDFSTSTWSVTSIPFFNVHNGGLAFVGAQGVSGVYITQGEIGTGLARFETQALQQWLSASPTSGTIPGGGTNQLTTSINAERMPGGTYNGRLTISTNEGNGLSHEIPITLVVQDAPSLVVTTSVDFGSTYVHSSKDSVLTIKNLGSQVLVISSLSVDSESFKVPSGPAGIVPGGQLSIIISFNPGSTGAHAGTLTINSNDPVNPTTTVSLTGSAGASRLRVTPNSFQLQLASGATHSQAFSIQNQLPDGTQWSATIAGGGTKTLEGIRHTLSTSFQSVTNLIPNKYFFSEGESGTSINDGGGDMYDGGNILSTNTFSYIPYTNGVIQANGAFGSSSRYFTVKHPALFALVADCNIQRFTIEGNLGADGSGSRDGAVLTVTLGGRIFKGFVKRVYNAFDPSVNHLIIVENNASLTHQYSSDTNNDFHQVENLSGSTRIYYLLFAASEGGYIDNASMENIMRAFLSLATGAAEWVTLQNTSGSLVGNGSVSNQINISAVGLPEGKFRTKINVTSNHGGEPFVVPVELTVGLSPCIAISKTEVAFGEINVGVPYTKNFLIKNTGAGPLVINSVSTSNRAFTTTVSKSTVLAGDSARVTVNILAPALDVYSGMITILSNDEDSPVITIPTSATAKLPPMAQLTSSTDLFEAFEGEVLAIPLRLSNTGGSAMKWSIATLPPWARSDSSNGTVLPGGEVQLTMSIDTDGFPIAKQLFTVTVNYNNVFSPTSSVTLTLDVKMNRAPESRGAIPSQTLRLGTPSTLDLSNYFFDADNQAMTYKMDNDFPHLIATNVDGQNLQMTPKSIGDGFLFVNAKDASGDSVSASFVFKVLPANHRPEVVKDMVDIVLHAREKPMVVNLAEYFRDVDNDDKLKFGATVSEVSIVEIGVVGSVFTMKPMAAGNVLLKIWAEDNAGERAEQEVNVEIKTVTSIYDARQTSIHAFPNPFTTAVRFEYNIPQSSTIEICLFDVTGKPVSTLVESVKSGANAIEFDASKVASGVYFYHFKVDGHVLATEKLVKQ